MNEVAYILLVWSAVSDLIIALLPAVLVWPLQMPRKIKLGISFLMGLGVFAALSSLMVVYYIKDITSHDASCKFKAQHDGCFQD